MTMKRGGGGGPLAQLSALRIAHLVACLILLLVMGKWAFKNHPVRDLWVRTKAVQEQQDKLEREARRHKPQPVSLNRLGLRLRERINMTWPYIWPDAALGTGVLLFFALGTGVYVKRFDIWLEAHGTGQAARLKGAGLAGKTVASNVGRRGGIGNEIPTEPNQ